MTFIAVAIILFLNGMGYAHLLCRKLPGSTLSLTLAISPLLGAAILLLEGGLLATNSVSLAQVRLLAGLSLLFSLVLAVRSALKVNNYSAILKEGVSLKLVSAGAVLLIVAAIAFRLNPFSGGFLSFRLGVDLAAYASATSEILGITPANQLSVEILRNAHRWGLPALAAVLHATIPFQTNIYELLFMTVLALYVSGALGVGALFSALVSVNSSRTKAGLFAVAFPGFAALALICNSAHLNYFNEGFYPQIIGTALLGNVLGIVLLLRNAAKAGESPLRGQGLAGVLSMVILLAILSGAIAVTYSEAFFLVLVFVVGCLLLDAVGRDWSRIRIGGLSMAGLLLGFILAFPVSQKLIDFTFRNSGNVANIGYPQPNWMYPSELLGVGTIYADVEAYLDTAVSVHRVPRTKSGMVLGGAVSVLLIWLVARAAIFLRDTRFVMTAALGIIGFFSVNAWLFLKGGMPQNYAYNKLSSILSVILIPLVLVGLHDVCTVLRERTNKDISKATVLIFISLVCITAGLTLKDSGNYRATVDVESINDLNPQLISCNCALLPAERGRRGSELIGKLRYVDRTGDFIMSSLLVPPVLDQWNRAAWAFNAKKDSKVFLLVRKDYLVAGAIIINRLVADSRSYAVIDAGTTAGVLSEKSDVELAKWINDVVSRNTLN